MAYKAVKTEHSGAKSKGRKSGYFGYRSLAKHESNRARRRNGKAACREGLNNG